MMNFTEYEFLFASNFLISCSLCLRSVMSLLVPIIRVALPVASRSTHLPVSGHPFPSSILGLYPIVKIDEFFQVLDAIVHSGDALNTIIGMDIFIEFHRSSDFFGPCPTIL